MQKPSLRAVILESPDNCGKDTQIRLLLAHFARQMIPFHVLKYSAPKVSPEESKRYFSKCLYDSMFELVLQSRRIVWGLNRAHISEQVYAPKYRSTDPTYIRRIEEFWLAAMPGEWSELALVTFVDKPENLISREDGQSFSIDPVDKQIEVQSFVEHTESSLIEKKAVINIDGLGPAEVHDKVMYFLYDNFNVTGVCKDGSIPSRAPFWAWNE